ncbi:hypothetical protein HK102_007849 [Quaeritorhiza haematococci]|nr:hypothetical protein HK102_007849 [Quaeritorhiza haematococci]
MMYNIFGNAWIRKAHIASSASNALFFIITLTNWWLVNRARWNLDVIRQDVRFGLSVWLYVGSVLLNFGIVVGLILTYPSREYLDDD